MAATTALPMPQGIGETVRTLRGLLSDPCPTLDHMAAERGRSFVVAAGPLRLAVVSDPAHLADLFATPVDAFRWGHYANVLGFVVGRTSMIVSDGDEHRHRRGQVQPALARRRLEGWIPMIVAEADRAIDEELLTSGAPLPFYPVGRDLVLSIVVRAFFGAGLERHLPEISAIFEEAQAYLEQPGPKQLPHPIPFTRRARVRAGHRRFDELVDAEMARRRSTAGEERTDLLDALLDGGPDGLTDEEIRDQVNTLIGAGYHTTAASLAWTVQRALTTPGVWRRLREEADDVFADDVGPGTLPALTYAGAVVRESLRLHPPGVFAPRQAVRDVVIGAHTIPKGAMVLWSPYLAGRDPSVWPDPLRFDPERHLDADPEAAALMESAWAPFGKGPRRCIGFGLAQMELTLILARLAQRLDLTPQVTDVPRPEGMVVSRPAGGTPVLVSRRQS